MLGAKGLCLSEEPWTTHGVFAIKPGGGGYLVDGNGALLVFDAEGTVTPVDRRAYAIAVIDVERWAIATRESREVVVRVGLFGAESVRLRSPRDIAKPEWPSALLFGEEPPYTRRKRFSENPGRLRVCAGHHALALSDSDSGLIALWRDGEMDWRLALRVPVMEGSELEAHPTADGLVARLRLADGSGVLLDFDDQGNLRDLLETRGSCALLWHEGSVLHLTDTALRKWTPSQGDEELLSNEAFGASGPATLAATGDGFVASCGPGAWWVRCDEETWSVEPIAEPTSAAEPMVVASTELKRQKGEPHLQLDATVEHGKWEVALGPVALELPLVNMGGPAAGLTFEVSGPARGSLFEPARIVARCSAWEPQEAIIELKGGCGSVERPITAGVEIPEVPKSIARKKSDAKAWRWEQIPEDAYIHLRLEGETKKKGTGLLTVRISLSDHGRHGSLLRGQSLTVE